MRTLRKFFSRAVLGLLISVWQAGAPVNAVAADYYVSTTGSDSTGNGSSSNPWATIAFASTQIGPGSTVHVEAGTYTGSFSTNASGTSTAYVTYVSATKWGAKLVATSGSTWSNSGNYVAIVDFDVAGPVGGINGIYTQGNATKIVGNNVHSVLNSGTCNSIGGSGINLNGPNAQVIGNFVHDNGPYPIYCPFIHGIYFLSLGGSAYNNIAFNNTGWGIQLWHHASHEVLANNTLFNNLTGGIIVGSSAKADNDTAVFNNIVYKNQGDGGICEEGKKGTNNDYENNLVFENFCANCSPPQARDWCLQNGNTHAEPAALDGDPDPGFVKFTGDTSGNYQLQSGSAAINTGTSAVTLNDGTVVDAPKADFDTDLDGVARPQCGAWDVGAYEYNGRCP